ncbi:MAG: NUDIX hydrolase [Gammaproteobacteria bacterium]|nr:NUDIX hydrolase [Gammaproteobacteria bacterium]
MAQTKQDLILHRQNIFSLIQSYGLKFPNELQTLQRLYRFVSGNPSCFERELLSGHITGSAWIVNKGFKKTLLTHHRKLDKWLQPGGHADGVTDVAEVALREAREESGLSDLVLVSSEMFDIDVHLIPAGMTEPAHYHFDCRFLICCPENENYVVSNESHDLAWVQLADIEHYTEEVSILRMVEKTIELR